MYPGVTEEEYLLVVEKVSGLKFNEDFFCWVFYSSILIRAINYIW